MQREAAALIIWTNGERGAPDCDSSFVLNHLKVHFFHPPSSHPPAQTIKMLRLRGTWTPTSRAHPSRPLPIKSLLGRPEGSATNHLPSWFVTKPGRDRSEPPSEALRRRRRNAGSDREPDWRLARVPQQLLFYWIFFLFFFLRHFNIKQRAKNGTLGIKENCFTLVHL